MTVGTPPGTGPQLVDGAWLNGLAGGQNETYEYGITASGTSSQSGSFQLAPGIALYEVDTAAANSGVALPQAVQGTEINLYNNGAQTLTVYPSIANNFITGSQDTINNTTSTTVASHSGILFFCAKTGIWAAH